MEPISKLQAGLWMFFKEALKLLERNDGNEIRPFSLQSGLTNFQAMVL